MKRQQTQVAFLPPERYKEEKAFVSSHCRHSIKILHTFLYSRLFMLFDDAPDWEKIDSADDGK